MTRADEAFERNTAAIRDRIERILDSRHVPPRVAFLEATRHYTLTVFERLREWWP